MDVDLLERIESTGSRLEKEALLATMDEETQKIVKLALDPDITFGITIEESDAVLFRSISPIARDDFWNELYQFLMRAKDRRLTGNAAEAAMWRVIQCHPTDLDAKWAARIINRQLRAGFDIRTFNSVFGEDAVYKFAVQLAQDYDGSDLIGLWYFQPKLDGNRVVFVDGVPTSRNGKVYPNCEHVVQEIEAKFGKEFWDKWVVDGEMMGDLGFDQSSGALRRINQKNRQRATFTYWAFDLIDREEWRRRQTKSLGDRTVLLEQIFGGAGLEHVKLVPTIKLLDPTLEQINEICASYVRLGFEGAMAKKADAPYVFKRGDNLLKVKLFSEAEFVVMDFYEGKGRNRGRLGGIVVSGPLDWSPPMTDLPKRHFEITSKCGSGFSDPLRHEVWDDQLEWLGATVQVKFFEPTKDGSLRFPIFVRRRRDKETTR